MDLNTEDFLTVYRRKLKNYWALDVVTKPTKYIYTRKSIFKIHTPTHAHTHTHTHTQNTTRCHSTKVNITK